MPPRFAKLDRRLLILILLLIFLAAGLLFMQRSLHRWQAEFYSGVITRVDSEELQLQDPAGRAITVRIPSDTPVRAGHRPAMLRPGLLIMVAGERRPRGGEASVEARYIRVIEAELWPRRAP